jgi:hypothetical protein
MGDGEEKTMRTLSVLAMTAALFATAASAQGVSERGGPRQVSAAADRSDVRHPIRATPRIERRRGASSYASVARARASSAFDGAWSVLIQTRAGDCEPSFRYGLQIQNGEVLNAGGEQVALEGHVAPNGVVRVSVAAGGQEAQGTGRLSQASGGGTWRGQGSRGACAGTWMAERRE